jgi:hypothetical protein
MNNQWKLVPVVPDWDMLSAGGCKKHHLGQQCLHHDNRRRMWDAMLEASPVPTQATVLPAAKVRGRREPQGISYELTAQTVSLKDGEEVSLYTWPTAVEELEAVLHWRQKHATAANQCSGLRAQLADLVTLGFKMTGASGAKRKQHTETLVDRLHELQGMLDAAGAGGAHDR